MSDKHFTELSAMEQENILIKKWQSKRADAQVRGIEFAMTITQLRCLYRAKKCFFTGLPLGEYNKLTLDRLDSSKGYVKGNVVACGSKFNHLKGVLERAGAKDVVEFNGFVDGLKKLAKVNK